MPNSCMYNVQKQPFWYYSWDFLLTEKNGSLSQQEAVMQMAAVTQLVVHGLYIF